jgi:hypothetical protein
MHGGGACEHLHASRDDLENLGAIGCCHLSHTHTHNNVAFHRYDMLSPQLTMHSVAPLMTSQIRYVEPATDHAFCRTADDVAGTIC